VISKTITALPDTQSCYNKEEMQAIASKLVFGKRMYEVHVKDSMTISELKKNIIDFKNNEADLKQTNGLYEQIDKKKDKQISTLTTQVADLTRKIKWIKVGWAATAVFLAGTTTYFIIK
jgi:hypothetical protein